MKLKKMYKNDISILTQINNGHGRIDIYLSNGKTYPRGWWDRSTTTSAIFSFNWYVRTVLFVIAIIFFLPY